MRFSLWTIMVVVTLAGLGLGFVAHERVLREQELQVVQYLQSWSPPGLGPPRIQYATCFDIRPGLRNLVLHSIRRRMGTRMVYRVDLPLRRRPIPGDILAKCSHLQIVHLVLSDGNVDLSELAKIHGLRQVGLWRQYPENVEPLARLPRLESVYLQLPLKEDHFARFGVVKNLKWVFSSRAHDVMTAPLRRAIPNCRILWLPEIPDD